MAYLMISERLTKRQWVGLIIGFLGFIPILVSHDVGEKVTRHFGFLSIPELVLIIGVAAAAYGWIVTKYLLTERSYSPLMINGMGMLGGGIMSFLSSIPLEGWPPQLILVSGSATLTPFWYSFSMMLFLLFSLILIGNVISFNLYAVLLRKYSTTFISFSGFTVPLFTATMDWLLWGQLVSTGFIMTTVIVIIGLFLFYQDELK